MNSQIEKDVKDIVNNMDGISLGEMNHVALMRRKDTKHVISIVDLPRLFETIKDQYKILEIDSQRLLNYETTYFDTENCEMYHEHHNKRLNRYKIRERRYVISDKRYLEIKFKTNKRETIKKRIEISDKTFDIEKSNFLKGHSPYSLKDIKPSLRNSFTRITLVHRSTPERITIDYQVNYEDVRHSIRGKMDGLAIIEVKRDAMVRHSDMTDALHDLRIRPRGFSKYCIGMAMLSKNVKTNLFRERLYNLNKLNKQASVAYPNNN